MKRPRSIAGQILRDERQRNLLQTDVATKLHWHVSKVVRIENDTGRKDVTISEFFMMAKAIGFDPFVPLKKYRSLLEAPR